MKTSHVLSYAKGMELAVTQQSYRQHTTAVGGLECVYGEECLVGNAVSAKHHSVAVAGTSVMEEK